MLFGRVSGFVWLPPEKVWSVLRFSSVVLGWYCGSLRLLVGDLGFVGFIHIPRLALRVCCCLVLPWLFFSSLDLHRLVSSGVGLALIVLPCPLLPYLLFSSIALPHRVLLRLALPCLVCFGWTSSWISFFSLPWSCLASPSLASIFSSPLLLSILPSDNFPFSSLVASLQVEAFSNRVFSRLLSSSITLPFFLV